MLNFTVSPVIKVDAPYMCVYFYVKGFMESLNAIESCIAVLLTTCKGRTTTARPVSMNIRSKITWIYISSYRINRPSTKVVPL